VRADSMEIFRAPDMCTGTKLRPKKFDKSRPGGYSDHFPIQLVIDTVP